jgi:hypothetical protein
MTENFLSNFISQSATFLLAVASLALSVLTYRRELGRLSVTISYVGLYGGEPVREIGAAVQITLVNVRKGAVFPRQLGGRKHHPLLYPLARVLPANLRPKEAVIFFAEFAGLFQNADGSNRCLTEGNEAHVLVRDPNGRRLAEEISTWKQVFVTDTTGRRHFVNRQTLSLLRSSVASTGTRGSA